MLNPAANCVICFLGNKMSTLKTYRNRLLRLFNSQYFMVLATQSQKTLHTSLVSFAVSDDLRWFYFVTSKATRKFQNLKRNPSVSLFIDNRSNNIKDIKETMTVTVEGDADEVPELESPNILKFFLQKNFYLIDFTKAPDSCLIRVKVKNYRLVTHFQKIVDLRP